MEGKDMTCKLKSYEVVPPGGFVYLQTEGIRRAFPAVPVIESQGGIVSAFRQKNGLPRSSLQECIADIDSFTCQRLGCMSSYCSTRDAQGNPTPALNAGSGIGKPCRGCGAPILVQQ